MMEYTNWERTYVPSPCAGSWISSMLGGIFDMLDVYGLEVTEIM